MTLCKMRQIPGLNRAGWQWLYSQLAIHGIILNWGLNGAYKPSDPSLSRMSGCRMWRQEIQQDTEASHKDKSRFGRWRGQSGPLPWLLASLLWFNKDKDLPLGHYGCCWPADRISSQQTPNHFFHTVVCHKDHRIFLRCCWKTCYKCHADYKLMTVQFNTSPSSKPSKD